MTSQTKKLISNLKKEIEDINKKETITQTDLSNYNFKKAQLQFARKLIEVIKKDIEKIFEREIKQKIVGTDTIDKIEKLNKILDEVR